MIGITIGILLALNIAGVAFTEWWIIGVLFLSQFLLGLFVKQVRKMEAKMITDEAEKSFDSEQTQLLGSIMGFMLKRYTN